MICHYCQSVNADDDHRCRRCGRRALASAVEAPPEHARRALQAVGANALAAAAATLEMERPERQAQKAVEERAAPRPRTSQLQPSLFVEQVALKVLPFERSPRPPEPAPGSVPLPETAEIFPSRAATARTAPRKPPAASLQATLDFLPPVSQGARLLKTTVEATIRCDSHAASPIHRSTAAALDAGLIASAFCLFFAIFRIFGGPVTWDKQTIPMLAGAFALISLFYGFLWVLADTETAGMRWTDLRLVTFNGFPLERRTRALRMLGCFLSFCSGTIGILWALVDEEGLTWHDHMSKTFPTLRDTGSPLIRQ